MNVILDQKFLSSPHCCTLINSSTRYDEVSAESFATKQSISFLCDDAATAEFVYPGVSRRHFLCGAVYRAKCQARILCTVIVMEFALIAPDRPSTI